MKLTGTLSKEFFGGDVWVLRTDEGAQYQLNGSVPSSLDGKKVKVSAKRSKAQFGISMVGDILDVSKVSAL